MCRFVSVGANTNPTPTAGSDSLQRSWGEGQLLYQHAGCVCFFRGGGSWREGMCKDGEDGCPRLDLANQERETAPCSSRQTRRAAEWARRCVTCGSWPLDWTGDGARRAASAAPWHLGQELGLGSCWTSNAGRTCCPASEHRRRLMVCLGGSRGVFARRYWPSAGICVGRHVASKPLPGRADATR